MAVRLQNIYLVSDGRHKIPWQQWVLHARQEPAVPAVRSRAIASCRRRSHAWLDSVAALRSVNLKHQTHGSSETPLISCDSNINNYSVFVTTCCEAGTARSAYPQPRCSSHITKIAIFGFLWQLMCSTRLLSNGSVICLTCTAPQLSSADHIINILFKRKKNAQRRILEWMVLYLCEFFLMDGIVGGV